MAIRPPSRLTGKPQPTPRELALIAMPFPWSQPIITVPAATTVPAGRFAGSLQVSATSPLRAAALPLIFTVGLPTLIVALLAGGLWNAVPGGVGICAGVLSAVLSTVAAGMPMTLTSLDRPPLRMPVNRCGRGVGTGPP